MFHDIAEINYSHRVIIAREFAINHMKLYPQFNHLYSPHSAALYQEGAAIPEGEYRKALEQMYSYREYIDNFMRDNNIHAWLSPATTTLPPAGLDSTGSPLMSLPWTFCGLPSLSLPSGISTTGLPHALQVVAAQSADEVLLTKVAPLLLPLL